MTRRLRMKRVRWAALAASVVVVIGGLMVFLRPGFPIGESIAVAHVHRADAGVRVVATNRGSIPVPVSTGSELLEGYRVLTEDGQVSFDLSEGGSVRFKSPSGKGRSHWSAAVSGWWCLPESAFSYPKPVAAFDGKPSRAMETSGTGSIE